MLVHHAPRLLQESDNATSRWSLLHFTIDLLFLALLQLHLFDRLLAAMQEYCARKRVKEVGLLRAAEPASC